MLALVRVFILFKTTIKTLISFDWTIVFIEHRPNLLEHAPCAFIGNTQLALQLFGADAAPRGRHEMDRIEPKLQQRGRILKDCPTHGMLMTAAELTFISWAL